MQPRQGFASRVERTIELREPAHRDPTQRSVLRYDLEGSLQYPGQLYENRRLEILLAKDLVENATPMLPVPHKFGPQLTFLAKRIGHHLESEPPTPYREAVLQIKRRVEAAQRGEAEPAELPQTLVHEQPTVAVVGESALDFVTTQFTGKESTQLRDYRGKSLLMIFYNPASPTADRLLKYAQAMSVYDATRLKVLLLSVTDDPGPALRQREALKLTLPIYSGGGLRISYGVETTPKLILIDPNGMVRGQYLGWGRETPEEVEVELKKWLFTPVTPERR
jgi:peroxiredoxin